MAKNHKRLKRLKSERAKVKLKAKKSIHQLPKGLNVTDTSFKIKKILIREQLQHRDETEILSTRKLNIKDLLTRLRHHNSTVREETLRQLKDILLRYPLKVLHSQLSVLLRGIAALSIDKEKDVRRDSLQSIIEYIDMLDRDDYDVQRIKYWFKDTFHNAYMKNFLSRFPYGKMKQLVNESRKRQEDFSQVTFTEECLEPNLALSRIHIWFTSLNNHDKQLPKLTKDYCISIMNYLNDAIENLCDSSALPQLTKLLRTLFLKASSVWYANGIDLSHTLQLIAGASSRLSKKELQSQLFLIIGDIMLECNLNELHREEIFKSFVTILPNLLLGSSIDDVMIRLIGQIALRFKEWIREELVTKHEAIIENAKKIDIVGSRNDRESRLIIYNLFYFMYSQVYY
ncbi:hypothetical protein ACFW04_012061 [Cataglyphis niger]